MKISTSMPRAARCGSLDDVDVHAAGVAGAGLVQRRGVHRQHRDAARSHGARTCGTWADLGVTDGTPPPSSGHVCPPKQPKASAGCRADFPRPWTRPPPHPDAHGSRHRCQQRHRRRDRPPARRSGLHVCAAARRRSGGSAAEDPGVRASALDVTDTAQVEAWPKRVGPRLDLLVNNAGGAFGCDPSSRRTPTTGARFRGQRARAGRGDQGAGAGAGRERCRVILNSGPPPDGSPTREAVGTPRPSTAPRWSPRRCGSSSTTAGPGRRDRAGHGRTDEFALVRFAGDPEKADAIYAGVRPAERRRRRRRHHLDGDPPAHVNIDELVIRPRAQAAQHKVHRIQD